MNLHYRRVSGTSYLIAEADSLPRPYEEEMLKQNRVSVLLPFYTRRADGRVEYWYDISSKRSVRDFVEQEGLTLESLIKLLTFLSEAQSRLSRYLIGGEHVRLGPDTVFVSGRKEPDGVSLCYRPGEEDPGEGLKSLAMLLMDTADPGQQELTDLCYDLYELTAGSFSWNALELLVKEYADRLPDPAGFRSISGAEASSSASPQGLKDIYDTEDEAGAKTGTRDTDPDTDPDAQDDDEDSDDEYDDDDWEEQGFLARLIAKLRGVPEELFDGLSQKKEELFEPKDLQEDEPYDPLKDFASFTADESGTAGAQSIRRLIYEGADNERDYTVTKSEFRIGSRDYSNDALLHSTAVSRRHARIRRDGDSYYIEDLNSKNGTFVNGELLALKEKRKLKPKDEICFADVRYRVE